MTDSTSTFSKDPTHHIGVTCDQCDTYPIIGTRYKCCVCDNFDLCETCEATSSHPIDHYFMKMRVRNSSPYYELIMKQTNQIAEYLDYIEKFDLEGNTVHKMECISSLFDYLSNEALSYVLSNEKLRLTVIQKCYDSISSNHTTLEVTNLAIRLLTMLGEHIPIQSTTSSEDQSLPPPPPILRRSDYRDPSNPLLCIPKP